MERGRESDYTTIKMPLIARRTPATEEASSYGYIDFLKDVVQKTIADTTAGFKRPRDFSDEEIIGMAFAGVGGGTRIVGGLGKGKFPFNLKTTDVPLWDAILKKPAYYKEAKGLERNIEFMSPEKYFGKIEGKLGIERETGRPHRDWADPEKVKKYAKEMGEGAKFPIPGLEYGNKAYFGQEGRHRMLAAELLGIDRVPVLNIRTAKKTENLVAKALESPTKKWEMPITRPRLATAEEIPKEALAVIKKYKDQGLTYDAFFDPFPGEPKFASHQWTFRGEGTLRGDTLMTKGTSLDEFEKKVASKIREYYGDLTDLWEPKPRSD